MITSDTVILSQGTVGILAGKEVSCANIATRTYFLNEKEVEGSTAYLALPGYDSWLLVGTNSTFEFADKNWQVTKIEDKYVYIEEQHTS